MNRCWIIGLLLITGLLLTACGGAEEATTAPPVTEIPTATEEPESIATPEDDSDFVPGTRLTTTDPLPANGENGLVLLASVGDVLVVGVEPSNGQDIALGLFYLTETGSELAAQVNEGAGYESLVYTFQVPGGYNLAIREMSGIDGEYEMRVACSPGVALGITPRHEVQGKLEGNPSVGYLHNGYAGQSVTFTVEPAVGYPQLDLSIAIVALTDLSTVLLAVDENGAGQGETAVFVPPTDDMYHIVVTGENGSSGIFSLTMAEP